MSRLAHRNARRAAGAVLVIAGSVVAADGREAHTGFTVSANVLAMARFDSQSAPREVQISAADLRRGYIDVAEPISLVVRSNSPYGFALDFTTLTPMISAVIVRGLRAEQSLGPDGGTIVQRWRGVNSAALTLTFRLVLAPELAAGRYPWPMQVAVRPLES